MRYRAHADNAARIAERWVYVENVVKADRERQRFIHPFWIVARTKVREERRIKPP